MGEPFAYVYVDGFVGEVPDSGVEFSSVSLVDDSLVD